MVSLKDFHVGESAYVVKGNYDNNATVSEYIVTSVGRRYVKVRRTELASTISFGASAASDEYLAEAVDFGWKRLLFPTLEQAQNYLEREELRKWVDKAFMYTNAKTYSLDQLRRVKAILEESK